MLVASNQWRGRRVLVTGHTGFKGSWLSLLLKSLGAQVAGYALAPDTDPNLFDAARIGEAIDRHAIGDIRDLASLEGEITAFQPEVIFHLAAQPLVRLSYDEPVETFSTNVMGTVNLLDAARRAPSVRAVVAVTSDKCYENREWVHPYRESDPMGGHDPYSASKGCSELVIASYRKSYFPADQLDQHHVGLASVRAGNVIGGGDWSLDRLIPDLVRAFEGGAEPIIRSPGAVRPWQHVLEALVGYVGIAQRLLDGDAVMADAWNFGPSEDDAQPVAYIVDRMARSWGVSSHYRDWQGDIPHEAGLLRLDCSKARAQLGWRPTLGLDEAIDMIVEWHKSVKDGADARAVTVDQIERFVERFNGGVSESKVA